MGIFVFLVALFGTAYALRHKYLTGRRMELRATKDPDTDIFYEHIRYNGPLSSHQHIWEPLSPEADYALGIAIPYKGSFTIKRCGDVFALPANTAVSTPEHPLHFAAGSPELQQAHLASGAFTKHIQQLFTNPDVTMLRAYNGRLWAELNPPLQTKGTMPIRKALATLAADLPHNEELEKQSVRHARYAISLMSFHGAAFCASILALLSMALDGYTTLDIPRLISLALLTSFALAFVWLCFINITLRHNDWKPLLRRSFIGFMIPALLLLSTTGLRFANIFIDQQYPTAHQHTILAKSCTVYCFREDSSRTYRKDDFDGASCGDPLEQELERIKQNDAACAGNSFIVYTFTLADWPRFGSNEQKVATAPLFHARAVGEAASINAQRGAFLISWQETRTPANELRPD